ncbi:MAG: hypothetical protein VX730_00635 [Pseudomonadota bacterium]|nr:hypothetical protein [Pseudomonadota bacterium]
MANEASQKTFEVDQNLLQATPATVQYGPDEAPDATFEVDQSLLQATPATVQYGPDE